MKSAKRKADTRKGDRHRPGYWVEYGRKRRAEQKAKKLSPSSQAKSK